MPRVNNLIHNNVSLQRRSLGLRAIAVFEIFKGAVALIGFLWVALGYDNVPSLMQRLVALGHLNLDGTIAKFLLETVAHFNPMMLAGVVLAYVALRAAEAYGLWHERQWAEWLAAISATIYIPLEILEIVRHVSWREVTTLVVNVITVIFLAVVLWRTRSRRQGTGA